MVHLLGGFQITGHYGCETYLFLQAIKRME